MKRFLLITVLFFGCGVCMFSQIIGGLFFVEWGETTLTYTGGPQTPVATITTYGAYGWEVISDMWIVYDGAETDVGTGYMAIIFCHENDPNYIDATLYPDYTPFEIVPATIEVDWGDTILIYNGYPQIPRATLTGVAGEDMPLSVYGSQTNVGTGYAVSAFVNAPSANYIVNNTTNTFRIAPAPVTIQWSNTSFIYDGNLHIPRATARGVFGENLSLTVTGAQTNIGTGYIATATLTTPDSNYYLVNPTVLFDIQQEPETPTTPTTPTTVAVQWSNTSLVYNGQPQQPTATATDDGGKNLPLTVTGAQTNVGTGYTATATLTVPDSNYTLSNTTTLFSITPAALAISANSVTIEYGQTPVLNYTITSGQLFGGDALTGALSVETLQAAPVQPPYPVGVYSIVQGTLTAGSNYHINFTNGTLTVRDGTVETPFDITIFVNDKSAKLDGDLFKADPAANGENKATVFVVADPADTVEINGQLQNPHTVDLSNYGDNSFTIKVAPQSGTPKNYTLIIERYYEMIYFEYPDVPTISCNPSTNGGFTFSSFQWYKDGVAIPDATGPYIQVKDNAIYHCELTPNTSNSVKLRSISVGPLLLKTSSGLSAFPNPTQGRVTIRRSLNDGLSQTELFGNAKIQVFDVHGILILQPDTNPFDMSALPEGIYFIRLNGETVRVIKTQ